MLVAVWRRLWPVTSLQTLKSEPCGSIHSWPHHAESGQEEPWLFRAVFLKAHSTGLILYIYIYNSWIQCARISLIFHTNSKWLPGYHLRLLWASPMAQPIKNPPAMQETQELGLISGSGRPPRRRKWQPTPIFLPGKSHGQRNLAGYSPYQVVTKSQAGLKQFSTHKIALRCHP